jgi:hypothetical protein
MDKGDKMRVVIKHPGIEPLIMVVSPSVENPDTIGLESLQNLVGGLIEYVEINSDLKIDCVINEEGKIIGLDPNFRYGYDTIVGTAVFVSSDNEGNTIGLNDEQTKWVFESFGMV